MRDIFEIGSFKAASQARSTRGKPFNVTKMICLLHLTIYHSIGLLPLSSFSEASAFGFLVPAQQLLLAAPNPQLPAALAFNILNFTATTNNFEMLAIVEHWHFERRAHCRTQKKRKQEKLDGAPVRPTAYSPKIVTLVEIFYLSPISFRA